MTERIAIIGLGKVGRAMGSLLAQTGYRIVALCDLREEALQQAHPLTGGLMTTNDVEAASLADTVFITTSDDAIQETCATIARSGVITPAQKYVFTSGACPLAVLDPARSQGAEIACLHPLQSFADVAGAIRNLPGSVFGVTASSPNMEAWARQLVSSIGGIPVIIRDGEPKTLYHIAACIASNYLTTLLHQAITIYKQLGMTEEQALKAILPLVGGTISNIERQGSVAALTGPIARGDVGTIQRHLQVIKENIPELLPFYHLLGLMTVNVAKQKAGNIGESLAYIEELLKGEDHEHPN